MTTLSLSMCRERALRTKSHEWRITSANRVVHRSLFAVELCEGTWQTPMWLYIHSVPEITGVSAARLVREGLEFAASQAKISRSHAVKSYC